MCFLKAPCTTPEIVAENCKLNSAQQQSMIFKKGQLMVNNEPYKKKVTPPAAKKLLKMDTDDLTELKELQVAGGHTETEDGS